MALYTTSVHSLSKELLLPACAKNENLCSESLTGLSTHSPLLKFSRPKEAQVVNAETNRPDRRHKERKTDLAREKPQISKETESYHDLIFDLGWKEGKALRQCFHSFTLSVTSSNSNPSKFSRENKRKTFQIFLPSKYTHSLS
ncbi:unnamed protein product [Sphenostylis stenocarpa]|uniref:Uncharacterized protein n=1 Tax=Sphenostylis stenocarpa TaxID=92480 RepID=A0AA86SNE6_9FABA|nr:unnamed protein product [Sphenostylis stenocarpa]